MGDYVDRPLSFRSQELPVLKWNPNFPHTVVDEIVYENLGGMRVLYKANPLEGSMDL
jgi:hypothetical protein